MDAKFHPTLRTLDYIVIAIMLLISSGIGIYFRFSGGKQRTTDEFLMAGRNMDVIPVAFSVMASYNSAISYLGMASEMYMFGTNFAFCSLGMYLSAIVAGYLFLPVFFQTGACSTYEYIERRYGKILRMMCSLIFTLKSILLAAICLYAPALALSAVTDLSLWISIVSVGVVCTIYSTLGGMKAVLWTDVFQAILMYGGLVAVIVKGCLDAGGIETVIARIKDGGRFVIPKFELDLTTRYTLFNVLINGFLVGLGTYGSGQIVAQRLLTVPSLQRAKWALFLHIPMLLVYDVANCFAGLVIYANFYDCDPLTSEGKLISNPDQLLPYFALTSFQHIPGLPGLCICGILSATLSTLSSIINSLSTMTLEEFIRPICSLSSMTGTRATILAKMICLGYGAMGLLLAFFVAKFGRILQGAYIVFGLTSGPILGVFLIGILTSRTNQRGAIIGFLIALSLTAWIGFGAISINVAHENLPVSLSGCPPINSSYVQIFLNETDLNASEHISKATDLKNDTDADGVSKRYIFPLYRISYMWFLPIAVLTTAVLGYFCSFVFKSTTDTDCNLMSPFMSRKESAASGDNPIDIKLSPTAPIDKNQDVSTCNE